MIKNLSLKIKIALTVSLLFLIFGSITAFFAISHMECEFKESLAEHQQTLARTIAKNIDDNLAFAQKSLLAASFKASDELSPNDLEEAQKFIDERVTLHSIFDNRIILFDGKGRLLAESPRIADPKDNKFGFGEYIARTITTRKPVISDPYMSRGENREPVIILTAPIFDKRGDLALILCGSFKLRGTTLLDNLPKMRIGESGYLSLTASDRTTIMHPYPDRVMKIFAEKGQNSLFDQAFEGYNGTDEIVGNNGNPELTTFIRLQNVKWVLGMHNPTSEAYAVMCNHRKFLITGFAAGTFGMLLISWLVARRITFPLISVTRQVKAMRTGSLRPLTSFAQDEIGTMTTAFNELIETVQSQQETLQEEQKKYRIVADNTYHWEFWLSPDHKTLYSSPSCTRITGFPLSDFENFDEKMARIVYQEDWEIFQEHRHDVQVSHGLHSVEFRIVCADGSVRWISHLCQPVYDHDGVYLGTRGSNQDITARKEAEIAFNEGLGQQRAIINNIPDMAWLKDRNGKYLTVNEQFSRVSGFAPEDVVGKDDTEIWPPELAKKFTNDDLEVIAGSQRKYFEEYVVDQNGRQYCLETVKTPIFNDRKEFIGIIGIAHDITARKKKELQLRHASSHDTLTGLYNRAFFDQELERLYRSRRFPVSIIIADVNGLKWVNDTYGHSTGDHLLQLAAQTIQEAFRADDIVARIGGDEFAVLLPETEEKPAEEAIKRVKANIDAANRQERPFRISIALGLSTAERGDDLLQAIRLGDERMYHDKAAQKATALLTTENRCLATPMPMIIEAP